MRAIRLQTGQTCGVSYVRRPAIEVSGSAVFLHGIGSNARSFERLMSMLPADIDAVAWDAPGYGSSTPLFDTHPKADDYAARVIDLLNGLMLDRVLLVGHSLGALFAGKVAARNPTRVAALGLLSPALGYRVPDGERLPPQVQDRIDELSQIGSERFARKRAPRLLADPTNLKLLKSIRRSMAAVDPASYSQAAYALATGDLLADAKCVTVPTLIVTGSSDNVTPQSNARFARDAVFSETEYHELDGAGHALPQEQPLILSLILAQFGRRVFPKAAT